MGRAGKVSIHDVAKRVGMSAATVSRVLNNRARVGSDTRQRVLEAARETGFRPRVSARSVTAGVVMDQVPDVRNIGTGLVNALTVRAVAALAKHQLAVEIFTSGNLPVLPQRFLDGVLAIAWLPETLDAIVKLENVPVVIFNRPELPQFSNVQVDEFQCGRIAARHLVEYGHRKIGLIGTRSSSSNNAHVAGMREVLAESGLSLPDEHVGMTHGLPPYTTLQRLLREGVTGLLIADDQLTYEVPFVCTEAMGMSLPRDLSLVGMGLSSALQFNRPPLTLIASPIHEMADQGVQLLDEMIRAIDRTPRTIKLMPELVVRESVARPKT